VKVKNPIQPLATDAQGVVRFKANKIVQHLLDTHPTCDMNALAVLDFTDDDRQQFAQLIGYSLSGYCSLTRYVDDASYYAAANVALTRYVDDASYYAAANVADGMTEEEARIAGLEQKLAELRAAVDTLREPMARLLEMHPDDLRA
jgi:hypothetical protein